MGLFIIAMVGLIILDQIIKLLVVYNLNGKVINLGLFNLTYYENYNMFLGKSMNVLMIILSLIVLFIFIRFFFLTYVKKIKTKINLITFSLIIAGGASNLIDRIGRGYVIDYLQLKYVAKGWIINLSDVCVFVGVILFVGMYLIKITDDKIETMPDGVNYGAKNNKDRAKWFKEYFKGR